MKDQVLVSSLKSNHNVNVAVTDIRGLYGASRVTDGEIIITRSRETRISGAFEFQINPNPLHL